MNLYNFDLIECVYVKTLLGHGRKLAELGYKGSAKKGQGLATNQFVAHLLQPTMW
jgi:hypothetical protein